MSIDYRNASNYKSRASTNRTRTQERNSISRLQAITKGEVITPNDSTYDQARTIFYGGFDRKPAVIIKAADETDVAHVVTYAREAGIELAVRGGGHSVAGHSVSNGGIVLDLSTMKELRIDPDKHTAWAQSGLTTGEYTTAAGAYGLATGFGDTGSVGIGGLTLGGGVGYLVRKYGLTIDDLLQADIVTADGKNLRIDNESHPDLFWAIRGGGGNFGVVTQFKFRLHEMDQIVGGMLILPATPDIVSSFVAEAEAAPEELSTIANVMVAPPMPFLPAEVHGTLIMLATLAYAGSIDEGQHVLAPFRALAKPIVDMVRPMRYPELYPPDQPGFHPRSASRNMFVDTFDRHMAETILDHLKQSTAMMSAAQVRVLGGAMARVPAQATAFAHRQRRIMLNVAAMYQRPDEQTTHESWAANLARAISQDDGDVYVNFLEDVGKERVRAAYPGTTWDRLVAVKAQYDPTNLFRLNHNVPPVVDDRD